MRLLKTFALLVALALPAKAGPYQGLYLSTTTGIAIENLSGFIRLAANQSSSNTNTIVLDGLTGSVRASSAALTGVNAAGQSLTAVGQISAASLSNTTFISTANFLNGFNAASQLVQLNGSGNLPALNAAALTSLTAANIVGAVPNYDIDLSTIVTALAGKLSTTAPINPVLIDLSTVTTALAGKLSTTAPIASVLIDLSTVTTALAGKLSTTAPINPVLIDLSTVTTAINNLAPVLDFKAPAKYIAVSALPANAYANGSSGVGATITGLGLGLLSIDGVSPAVGKRVVINGEATHSHNGIYTVTTNAGGAFFVLTRATDHDQAAEMTGGVMVEITDGVTYDSSTWVQQTDVATVGTDAVDFYQTNGLGDITAGTGLSKSVNTISLVVPVVYTSGGTNATTAWTQGSVFLAGASAFVQDNANFFWDAANHRLGLGTATPATLLDVTGASQFGNNTTYGNSKVSTFTANGELDFANSFQEAFTSTKTEVNAGSLYTVSATSGTWQVLTLTANSTLNFNNFGTGGKGVSLILHQDATGSRTITAASCKWPAGTAPTLTTTAYKKDTIYIFYDGTDYLCNAGPANF